MNSLSPGGPLGEAVSKLCEYEQCDIVVSAPRAALLAGEHSVVPGGPALVTVLPRRVFVGVRGKLRRDSSYSALRILHLRAFDRRSNSLESPEMDLLTEYEQLSKLASGFKTLSPDKLAKYVPTVIYVVCDGYPARGCNFSGAFAAALALAILAVNGEIHDQVPWRGLPLKEQIHHKAFKKAFKLAMLVETIAHEHPSGYGAAFGLLDFDDQPVLYFPHVSESRLFFKGVPLKIKDFAVAPATALGISSDVFQRLGLLVIDTGVSKTTKETIAQVRTVANDVTASWTHILNQAHWTQDLGDKARASMDETFIDGRHAPYRLLAACSTQVIHLLSRASVDPNFGVKRLLAQIRAINETHIALGLDWKEYRDIRHMLCDEIVSGKVATKLTGGGGGGCIVVLGARATIESVASRLKDRFAIVFNSLNEEFEHLGPVFVRNANPSKIRIEAADDVLVRVSKFDGLARSFEIFGPGPTSRVIDEALQFLYRQGNITYAFFLTPQRERVFDMYRLAAGKYELKSLKSTEVRSRPLLWAMLAAIEQVAHNGYPRSIAGEVVVSLNELVERYRCIKGKVYINTEDFRERLDKTGKPSFNRLLSQICTVASKGNSYRFSLQQPLFICSIVPIARLTSSPPLSKNPTRPFMPVTQITP